MSFLTGKTSSNTFEMNLGYLETAFQRNLYQVFTVNEVSPEKALLLANAEMKDPSGTLAISKYNSEGKLLNLYSGFTFGVIQFDLAGGPEYGREAFRDIMNNANIQSGNTLFTQDELNIIAFGKHYKDKESSAEAINYRTKMVELSDNIDLALQSEYGEQKIQEITAKHLDSLEKSAQNIIDYAVGKINETSIGDAVKNSDFAKLLAGDLANNAGASGGKKLFNSFLEGYLKSSEIYTDQGFKDWIQDQDGIYDPRRADNILKFVQNLPAENLDIFGDTFPLIHDPIIDLINEVERMVMGQSIEQQIKEEINSLFTSATVATPPVRRDPLVFDLDGDGLETTGVNTTSPIYFDHDADGIKTATGWVKADDAFLVLDKNANGTIDSGRELFGDAMIKSNGQLAVDGFDALRDLDSNADGKVNATDAQFANLRLWRDLNQDGISQANELFTLGSQNIAAINVGSTEHSQILANGNQLADIGSYVKTDVSGGTMGEVSGNLGDINLVQDTFHSQFTDRLDTSAVATLPDMQGAGQVRNLREAATLSTGLAQLLTDFAAADRAEQQALLDTILKAWSNTSTMATTFGGAYSGHSLTVNGLPAGTAANDKTWRMAA